MQQAPPGYPPMQAPQGFPPMQGHPGYPVQQPMGFPHGGVPPPMYAPPHGGYAPMPHGGFAPAPHGYPQQVHVQVQHQPPMMVHGGGHMPQAHHGGSVGHVMGHIFGGGHGGGGGHHGGGRHH